MEAHDMRDKTLYVKGGFVFSYDHSRPELGDLTLTDLLWLISDITKRTPQNNESNRSANLYSVVVGS